MVKDLLRKMQFENCKIENDADKMICRTIAALYIKKDGFLHAIFEEKKLRRRSVT